MAAPKKPPRPPNAVGLRMRLDTSELHTTGFSPVRTPINGARLHILDASGQYLPLPRPKGRRGKKHDGDITLILGGSNGKVATIPVRAALAEATIRWAEAFTAWNAEAGSA
ncbi:MULTISPECIES: hypothetical protein [Streptacidiphilus]|uniref:Uncharacterized protein n=1 Tax=Streptacidiphilus cavernicola TaxID=3342716 RepID=A0ABV6UTS9_9ACTN|nr:hypothetical protein [Streptacidiphilus jeojiense]